MKSPHHRVARSTAIRALTSRNPLVKLVCEHEFAGKGAFLFQAACRAIDIFDLRDMRPEIYFIFILIPSNHHLTRLLIEHEHLKLMHAGAKLTLASLREKYWVINGLNTVKGV